MGTEADLRSWLRSQPGSSLHPRWPGPREARATLSSVHTRALRTFEHRLRDAWLSETPHLAGAEAFAALDPASRVAFYPSSPPGGPPWFVQSITTGSVSLQPLRNHDKLASVRMYEIEGDDPFADHPANLPALARCATNRQNAIPFIETLLHPNDVHQQLRMVLYRSHRAVLYVGWYRRERDPMFDEAAHALLLAARPALSRWRRVATAIGLSPLGDGALIGALQAVAAPALLVSGRRVLFANRAGEGVLPRFREWDRAGRPRGFGDVVALSRCGAPVELVLPHRSTLPHGRSALPSSLHRVAVAMAAGLGDKAIASELGIPDATVRTYVARVLRRLQMRDRREVIRRASELGLEPPNR